MNVVKYKFSYSLFIEKLILFYKRLYFVDNTLHIYETNIDATQGIVIKRIFRADENLKDYLIMEKPYARGYGMLYISRKEGEG